MRYLDAKAIDHKKAVSTKGMDVNKSDKIKDINNKEKERYVR